MVTQDHPWQMSLNKIISLNYASQSIVFGAGNREGISLLLLLPVINKHLFFLYSS